MLFWIYNSRRKEKECIQNVKSTKKFVSFFCFCFFCFVLFFVFFQRKIVTNCGVEALDF